jgi:hypothetical protein
MPIMQARIIENDRMHGEEAKSCCNIAGRKPMH